MPEHDNNGHAISNQHFVKCTSFLQFNMYQVSRKKFDYKFLNSSWWNDINDYINISFFSGSVGTYLLYLKDLDKISTQYLKQTWNYGLDKICKSNLAFQSNRYTSRACEISTHTDNLIKQCSGMLRNARFPHDIAQSTWGGWILIVYQKYIHVYQIKSYS